MTLPNMLTIFRLGLVGVFLYTFYGLPKDNVLYSFLIFTLAEVTDMLDGYIARRYNMISDIGKVLDPVADKAMLLAMLFALSSIKLIPTVIFAIVLMRESLMMLGALILYNKSKVVPYSKWHGKTAAVIFYIAIFMIIFHLPYASALLILAVGLNVISLIKYIQDYIKFMDTHENKAQKAGNKTMGGSNG